MLGETLSDLILELAGDGSDPLAVAFSGGGDSTALLQLLIQAVTDQDRTVHALIVDHKLRRGSGVEAKLAADRAQAMGARPVILKWLHDNPTTGIQEKARAARYELMGETCRRLNITKLFLGHNQGDQIETVLMRQRKGSGWRGLAGMQISVMAPMWPQLRGIEVLRPLLEETREDLRAHNVKSGLEYIEDPSNEHHGFERVRTRQELLDTPELISSITELFRASQQKLIEEKKQIRTFIDTHVDILDWGGLWIKPSGLQQDQEETIAALRLLIPSVSGSGSYPPVDKLHYHIRSLKAGFTAGTTLGGARLLSREKGLLIVRDAGMVLGRHQKLPVPPLKLKPAQPVLWDGRFEIETSEADIEVVALGRVEGRPDKKIKKALKAIPLAARKTIPVFCTRHEIVNIPFVDSCPEFTVKSLIYERLNTFGVV